jgi:hypothetical protein
MTGVGNGSCREISGDWFVWGYTLIPRNEVAGHQWKIKGRVTIATRQ